MKKILLSLLFCIALSVAPTTETKAGFWVVVQEVIKQAIKAIDLAVQRLQNKTIWLQNAQKALENEMAKLKLDQIGNWVEKQQTLYSNYYEELRKVKELITLYQQIKRISQQEASLVSLAGQAMQLFKTKGHFTAKELRYMESVYAGILRASLDNIDQATVLLQDDILSMHDADRLRLLSRIISGLDAQAKDLREFTRQNQQLSLQRAGTASELKLLQRMYGIQ